MSNGRNAHRAVVTTILGRAVQRVRERPLRGVLVAAGVAIATATLLGVVGGSVIASDLRVRAAPAAATEDERTIRISWRGTPPEGGTGPLDARTAGPLDALTVGPVARAVLLRETNLGGRGVVLAGVDDLDRWLQLDRGRRPGQCRPERCEVVRVAGIDLPVRGIDGARLAVVGSGRLRSTLPLGDVTGDRARLGEFARTPVLVAGDRDGVANLPSLAFVYRNFLWSAPVDPKRVHPWSIDDVLRSQARAAQTLAAADPAFAMSGPDAALSAARDASVRGAARIQLVGGAAVALLLGFVLLAGRSLRDEHAQELGRLARRGAGRGARVLLTVAERAWMALVGVATGWVLALAVTGLIAARAGVDTGAILRHSLLSSRAAVAAVLIWIAATAVLVLAQRPSRGPSPPGRLRPLDMVALGGVAVIVLAIGRGDIGADRLAGDSSDPLLVLLPLIIALVAAIAVLRGVPPLLQLLERLGRRGGRATRLAFVAVARRPERPAATAAFLVVGLGLAVFAQGYRATLERGSDDQAAFAVPADATITQGASLDPPRPSDLVLDGTGRADPVTRRPASLRTGSVPTPATLLGVPSGSLRRSWRDDHATMSGDELGRGLAAVRDGRLDGATISPDVATLSVSVTQVVGPAVTLRLLAQSPAGETLALPLAPASPGRLSARVAPAARGGRVVALEAVLGSGQQVTVAHAEGEGRGSDAIVGRVRLGPIVAEPAGRTIVDWSGWEGRGAMRVTRDGARVIARYALGADRRALLWAPQPWATAPLPVVLSADRERSVGVDETIAFAVGGVTLRGRVVAHADRFPTVANGSFIVADQGQLARRLELADPGSGRPTELWVTAAGDLREVRGQAERAGFAMTTRQEVRGRLVADPLGRGILWTLLAAAVVAVVLGVVALLLALIGDIRDERRELADLALQGVATRTLRAHLWRRGAIVTAIGVLGGLVLGTVLSLLVVRVVRVAADTRTPVPPLVHVSGWTGIAIGVVAYLAASALALALVTRRSFSGGVR